MSKGSKFLQLRDSVAIAKQKKGSRKTEEKDKIVYPPFKDITDKSTAPMVPQDTDTLTPLGQHEGDENG